MITIEERSAIGVHHTSTSDAAWDGPANEARLRNDGDAGYYTRAFAWRDVEEDGSKKAHYKFIHHEVASDGAIGAANLRACSTGIAVLNGGRGGTTIPDSDRRGVWSHLAAHLRDGDREPPELASFQRSIERRHLGPDFSELRAEMDADSGTRRISWYAAVFDSLSEDLGGWRERISRRAFTKTLEEHDIRALFNHDPNLVLGRNKAGTLLLRTDNRGLRAEVLPPDTLYARDLVTMIERGDVSGGSIGFRTEKETWAIEENELIRNVQEVRLYDVSPVTFPAYPETEGTASVRAFDLDRIRAELERIKSSIPLALRRRQLELARLR